MSAICQRCGEHNSNRKNRFCGSCRKKVLAEMSRSGFLQSTYVQPYFSEERGRNRFIYDTVVESLRRVKTSRQLLLITHNPNIPVLGDAAGVFVLTSDGAKAWLLNNGDVDACKPEIINLLEGGEEAFAQRRERYAR